MDAIMTKSGSDFNNARKTVDLEKRFTKTLIPAAVMDGVTQNVLPGSTQTLCLRASGKFHLLGVNPQGEWKLARFDSNSSFTRGVAWDFSRLHRGHDQG